MTESIREQFNFGPYPRIPFEQSPQSDPTVLWTHNLVTPFYLRDRQVINPADKVILDVGCGTGYGTLALAQANPEAKVIGIDLSEESIQWARSRVATHHREDIQLQVMDLQSVSRLGLTFDYINCDEVFYLSDTPVADFEALMAVLKPDGIIRANFHSAYQRADVYRGQTAFQKLGLFDHNPEAEEINTVQAVMKSLKSSVNLKSRTWKSEYEQPDATENILMNYLFQRDRGCTLSDVFSYLEQSELELIKMVNWHQWHLWDLFKNPESFPPEVAQLFSEVSETQRLELFELFHPVHRLLDFWCSRPQTEKPRPISQWRVEDWAKQWSKLQVYLHPQLRTEEFREACINSIRSQKPLALTNYLNPYLNYPVVVDTSTLNCLLPLIENSPQSLHSLLKRWLELSPRDPISLEPILPEQALAELKNILTRLEVFLYVLVAES
ncbi:methyltransferase domain-containing protein [Euhalothece natronophila Z-M001]|uniref:Methyltransferase domain-containing protein n=1 Tax=Euhalothece natronophila Z-M001 TaxID=522448 RepID=A0A5B8NJV4_9CHRO|nr:class I SAM-dependent methyltransferase [Euhalothece natronophila]QDZ39314.1 methyltransferase domain-containing protein [Euhalothece natronophila Z-M001]